MTERYRVVLEDRLIPKTSVFVRALTQQLNEDFGELSHRVVVHPSTVSAKGQPLSAVVSLATAGAKKAAADDETMALYILPATFGYVYGTLTGASTLMVSAIAIKEGPVGLFLDFPDGPNIPDEVFKFAVHEIETLKKSMLKKAPKAVCDRTMKFMTSVRAGLQQWPKFYN